jgi:hypothetical protein
MKEIEEARQEALLKKVEERAGENEGVDENGGDMLMMMTQKLKRVLLGEAKEAQVEEVERERRTRKEMRRRH